MEQQLSAQVVEQLNRIEETQKQIEISQSQLKEKRQVLQNLFVHRQSTCNHVLYAVLDLFMGTWVVEEYHCCICRKRISREEFKEPPHCVGSYKIDSWSSFHEALKSPEAFPIPAEYQAQAEASKGELSQTASEIAALENNIAELQASRISIESDLKKATQLLINRLNVPILESHYRSFFG